MEEPSSVQGFLFENLRLHRIGEVRGLPPGKINAVIIFFCDDFR